MTQSKTHPTWKRLGWTFEVQSYMYVLETPLEQKMIFLVQLNCSLIPVFLLPIPADQQLLPELKSLIFHQMENLSRC
jgi:hypothetical protein